MTDLSTDAALDRVIDAGRPCAFVLPFDLPEPWRGRDTNVRLFAAYHYQPVSEGFDIRAFVTTTPVRLPESVDRLAFAALAASYDAALLDFGAPFPLQPVEIPKPWGRERWFTGIESRGVSRINTGGRTTPLPWALACAPLKLCAGLPVTLLKTLDPLPEPVYGDLYFELHEEKREVYVVTYVDPDVWPNGTGAIRYGMNQQLRRSYPDDDAFRSAYVDAVKQYERIRRTIDEHLDKRRAAEGYRVNDVVPPATLIRWSTELGGSYMHEEARLRQAMDRFTDVVPLVAGDVVEVELRVPHALQHGVRVLEFQTPVFERQILSFGQKVLTQPDWNTEAAVRLMNLDAPQTRPFVTTHPAAGVSSERIVDFPGFSVHRVTVAPGAAIHVPVAAYAVGVGVTGEAHIGSFELAAETACLVPGSATDLELKNSSDEPAVVLFGGPAPA